MADTFEDAMTMFVLIRDLQDDLPDGMWEKADQMYTNMKNTHGHPLGWNKEIIDIFIKEINSLIDKVDNSKDST